jgi:glycosyltransferase involved in cell wall biosynthesis
MRVAFITAGAAGMICGSCLRDNVLVRTLRKQGRDCLLIPTYTPPRTDSPSVSLPEVFFSGLSVYLEQKIPYLRRPPNWLQRWLSSPTLLRWISRLALTTRAEELGELTLSMLRGLDGYQACEIERLVHWLAHEYAPDLVCFSNILLSGAVPAIKERLDCTVVTTLQGDDIFLEHLPPSYKQAAIELIRHNARYIDAYLVPCQDYADFMADYLGLPRSAMTAVYLGIDVEEFDRARETVLIGNSCTLDKGSPRRAEPADLLGTEKRQPWRIGYLARICPEKGLHVLVEAVEELIRRGRPVVLEVAGYLGPADRHYFEQQRQRAIRNGWQDRFCYRGELDYVRKVQFLTGLDVFSVPTIYREPKGLYVLEAWAAGLPVVQPAHGSFPELIGKSGAGILFPPGQSSALADALDALLHQPQYCRELGQRGRQAVETFFHAHRMAEETWQAWQQVHASRKEPAPSPVG